MAILHLPLKRIWYEQILSGEKIEEFRLVSPYWTRRLEGSQFDGIVLTLGYPPREDSSRRIERPWRGMRRTMITHPHFGPDAVEVFAIRVN